MNTIELIRDRLALMPVEHLDIEDESAQHAGHAGARSGGGHFRMHIISTAFHGKTTLARHRMVYDALGELMQHQIHALSITAHTPEEL
ncbi:MAG: BolA family protein [Pseudomonadota bacterium]